VYVTDKQASCTSCELVEMTGKLFIHGACPKTYICGLLFNLVVQSTLCVPDHLPIYLHETLSVFSPSEVFNWA